MWGWRSGQAAAMTKTVCYDLYSAGTKLQLLSVQEPPFISTSWRKKLHLLFSGLFKIWKQCLGDKVMKFFFSFLTGQVDWKVIKTNSLTTNFSCVIDGGKRKEPKVGKTVNQKVQPLLNTASCNRLPSGRAGVHEPAEQSNLIRQLGIKALIRFQFLPLLSTSWSRINIPYCVKTEHPRWHNQVAYSDCHEIVPHEDVR